MARRPRGSGYIRERRTRTGAVRFDVKVREGGRQITIPHPRGGACHTRDEAEALLNTYLHEKRESGDFVPYDTGILTVRQLGHLFLDTRGRDDRSIWRARVDGMAEFIDWPLVQVDERAVRRWVHQMCNTQIASGKSAGRLPGRTTIQNALNLLRSAWRWAIVEGYTDSSPATAVTIRDSTTRRPKSRAGKAFDFLTEEEARKLLEHPELPDRQRTIFVLLAWTGARPMDLWSLTWDRVDARAGRIRYHSVKTHRDYVVHALPEAHQVLRAWWLACGRPKTGHLFLDQRPTVGTGGPHTRGYDAGWHRWRQALGIRPMPLYSLRHTCACQLLLGSELFTGGRIWSREEIQSQLGHSSSKTTEHYMVALGLASKRAAEESRAALKAARKGR